MSRAVTPLSARERILDTAVRLFYEHGYNSVGVDRIIAESGVAKMSLYRHFASKDVLIAACLDHMNGEFNQWMKGVLARAALPREKLLAMFRAVQTLATSSDCRGCTFQAAAAEFPELEHINHKAALAHKEQVLNLIVQCARDAGLLRPRQLAQQLLLLMDGAWASSRMYGPKGPARAVAAAAQSLIESSTPKSGNQRSKVPRKKVY